MPINAFGFTSNNSVNKIDTHFFLYKNVILELIIPLILKRTLTSKINLGIKISPSLSVS